MEIYAESYLMHHGVLGQKWGVRRYQNPDGTRIKKRNTDNRKESALASTAALFLVPNLSFIALSSIEAIAPNIKANVKESLVKKDIMKSKIDSKSGLPLKNREMKPEEDMKRVNPANVANCQSKISEGTRNNCMLCTTAYDLRRRGYNVMAAKTDQGFRTNQIKEWYPKCEIVSHKRDESKPMMKSDYADQVLSTLSKQKNARGNFMLNWDEGGGHSIIYEVNDSKVTLRDAQSNFTYKDPNKQLFPRVEIGSVQTVRLDNVEPDYKVIKERGLVAYDFSKDNK